jgi:long-subunit fatty acid transport protein
MVSGIFGSFSDAPGGFSEELREINYAMGAEYMFSDQFAIRAGYFYEHPTKGDRQFITLGGGFKTQKMGIDLAYILAQQQKSPIANTLRFSLSYKFP